MKYKEKKFKWRGQEWTLRPLCEDDADIAVGTTGVAKIQSLSGTICYRGSLSRDQAIMAILHEVGHELFPEWSKEPGESSKSEIGIFERDLKAFGDAVGIDWSPLLGTRKK